LSESGAAAGGGAGAGVAFAGAGGDWNIAAVRSGTDGGGVCSFDDCRRGFVPLAGGELDGAAAGGELAGESDGAAAGGALAGESLAGREFAPGVGSWITLGPGAGAAGAGAFVAGAAAEGDGGALGSAFSVSVRVSADEVPPSSNRRKAMWTPPTMIITTAAATITLRRC